MTEFRPVGVSSSSDGSRVRVYSGPKWVRPDGKTWQPIEQVVRTSRDPATGVYRVTCGDDWITFTPHLRPAGLFKRAVVASRHFGDILDGVKVAAQALVVEYAVAFSKGVKLVADGWQFEAVRDVPLGVFLGDLRGRFPQAVACPTSELVRIDLTGVKPDELGEINLDPTVTATANTGRLQNAAIASWAARDTPATIAAYANDQIRTRAQLVAANNYSCYRGFLDFDLTALSGIFTAATLTMWVASVSGTDTIDYFSTIPDYTAGGLTAADWVPASYAAQGLKDFAGYITGDQYIHALTNPGQILTGAHACLCVRQNLDVTGDAPVGTSYISIYGPNEAAKEPYLELTPLVMSQYAATDNGRNNGKVYVYVYQ